MYSFPNLEPVCHSMSSSNCCFLTCIQISQEAHKVVWYSHLLKNFPHFVVIHTVKGFGVDNLISGSSVFSKSSLKIWKFMFTYYWSLAWRILSIHLLACEMSAIVQKFEHSLALPFFGIGMKTDLFQSCGHCWVFQICWHIECSTFIASSFRIWNSSAGIPSPPLSCS